MVAWESDDTDLKATFRAGLNIHVKNARDMFPERVKGWSDEAIEHDKIYREVKGGVHAIDYGSSARTAAINFGWTVAEAERFRSRWFALHPGIKEWHNRTERQLQGIECWRCRSMRIANHKCLSCDATVGRTVANRFGYRRTYFDRIEGLLPEALAWIPQSTVAIITEKGMCNVEENLKWVQLLLQVHDSVVFQYPYAKRHSLQEVLEQLSIIVPYEDPLLIPWGLATSQRSWGDVEPAQWAA